MSLRSPLSPVVELIKREPRSRPFFLAHTQSSLGNGAAYVALLVIAYERFHSAWAITLILLADMLPPMLLGPLFGAAADRWSRRGCAVLADAVRAVAFVGIALFGSFESMLAFALVAGMGTALFRPAILAGLPSLVDKSRLPAATALYGAVDDLGHTLGPVLAAGLLLLAGPETVMVANGVTFALSALLLARLPFGTMPAIPASTGAASPSLVHEAGDGLRAVAGMPAIRMLIAASSGLILFAGLFNVGELLLASDELGAGESGYAILVAVFGLGVVAGSLTGSNGGSAGQLKQRYLLGVLLTAAAFAGAGLAPAYAAALVAFGVGGVGNGLVLVHERLLLQELVPDALMGRVFGVRDTVQSWAFAPGFICAGVLSSLLGTRALFLIAGVGALAVWAAASYSLRQTWTTSPGRPLLAGS
jgi:MFS family permease